MIATGLLFLTLISSTTSIGWLGIGTRDATRTNWESANCSQAAAYGLIDQQVNVCNRRPELLPVIANSARAVLEECQDTFSKNRWNCDVLMKAPTFPQHLQFGTREQAAVYALSSAALGLGVARACGEGWSANCKCPEERDNERPRLSDGGTFWEGCRYNLKAGQRFAKSFIYPEIMANDSNKLVRKFRHFNKHNTNIGLKVLAESQRVMCRCVGSTGSCNLKICWKQLPGSLGRIAAAIKEKYDEAMKISRRNLITLEEVSQGNGSRSIRARYMRESLLFSRSVTYCDPDSTTGSLGTYARRCDPDDVGTYGCNLMCCGRGYFQATEKIYSDLYCQGSDRGHCYRDVVAHYCH